MEKNNFDLVVVGAGVHGLSTCLYLAMKYPKLKFALIQQFKIGHGEGSSHSDIRIIRSTYFQEVYMNLCIQAIHRHWPEVQKLLGQQFIQSNQCLTYTQSQQQFKTIQKVANKSNGQIQLLSLEQIKNKYPTVPNVHTGFPIFLDKKAGIVYAERYLSLAAQYLRKYKTEVTQLWNSLKSVTITAKKGNNKITIDANRISLSCGRWIGKLIPKMNKIVQQVRQTVGFWQMKQPQNYLPGKYPCWIYYRNDKEQYYCLPNVFNTGVKFAHHNENPNQVNSFQNQDAYIKYQIKDLHEKNKFFFNNKIEKLKKVQKCYYTVTKTENFVIDWSDQNQNILVVSPCSGHGFKFGPIIGNIIADLLVNKKSFELFQSNKYEFKIGTHMEHIKESQIRSKL